MTWVEKHFSELYAESSRNGLYKSPEFHGSGCRIVNMTEMFAFEFIGNQEMQKVELDEREMQRDTLTKGDLLFGRRSIVPQGAGKCALVTDLEDHLTFESSIIRTRLKQTIAIPKFYYYWFNSPVGRREVDRIVSGTNIKGITGTDLQKIVVPNPPLEQQRRIVEILSDCDAAIEILKDKISKSLERMDGLRQKFITKAGFQKQKLQHFLIQNTERVGAIECGRVLSVTNQQGFVLAEDKFGHRVASANLSNYKIVNNGDFAYNPSRLNVGSIARLDEFDAGLVSPMYVVFRLRDDKLDSDFFRHWLDTCEAKERIKRATQGSVRESVSFDDLSALPMPSPPLSKQLEIVKLLNSFVCDIKNSQKSLKLLEKHKRGLMQQLLTGKLSVQGAA